jgi:hypothetical protein
VFELLVADVQSLLRELGGRKGQPTAVCIDSRTLQSTPESASAQAITEPSAAGDRRLAHDYERLDSSLKGFPYIAFACIMLARLIAPLTQR